MLMELIRYSATCNFTYFTLHHAELLFQRICICRFVDMDKKSLAWGKTNKKLNVHWPSQTKLTPGGDQH